MTVTNIPPTDRTGTYEDGDTFVQWTDNTNAVKLSFATGWNFTPSMDAWDADKIDTAEPIFTKISDVLGTFSLDLKNTISLYDTALPPTNPLLLSKWIADIAIGKPPSIIFAPVMKSAESLTNPFINFIYTGRIMNLPIDQVLEQGVQDAQISGEITNIAQVRREATANNEG